MESFESRLRLLLAQIEVTGKNIQEFQGVQSLVYVDDATGLYNTRYLYSVLDREILQSQVTQKSFAILFMDGDRFKSINDNHGHLVGTKVLNELGNQLRKYTRGKDTVFRYGGDEFVAVLSQCDMETAKRVAERIRMSIERHVFLVEEGLNLKITISIGVALYPDHANSIKAVINCADHAMYTAKRGTRNSVFVAPLPDSGEEGCPAAEAGTPGAVKPCG
jgi:diguanylate cyclase (GGDEF)-like protein